MIKHACDHCGKESKTSDLYSVGIFEPNGTTTEIACMEICRGCLFPIKKQDFLTKLILWFRGLK